MPKGLKLLDAYVEVSGDGKQVVPGVVSDIDKSAPEVTKAGSRFGKRLVGGIIASAATYKIAGFLGDSIMQASDLNETVNAASVIFGTSADQILNWGSTSATAMGLSKQAAIDAATGFGDMFLQLGFTQDAATKNSTAIVQMAADLGSFKNLPTAQVVDMISASLRGEYDSLQRVIPNINAARVEKEALLETGKKNAAQLTAQEKAQATLNIIQQDGTRAAGDFGKTQDGVANQMKIAQAQTADLQAELGTALLPIVAQLAGFITATVLPVIKDFAKWITQNKDAVGPLLVVLGLLAAAIWIVNIAMYANPVGLIIAGVVALIAVIVLLVTNWDTVVKFITDIWHGWISWISGVMAGFVGWWKGLWDGLFGWVRGLWDGLVHWIVGLWLGYIGMMRDIGKGLISWWNGLWNGLAKFVSDAFRNIGNFVIGMLNRVIGLVNGAIAGINSMGRLAKDVTGGVVSWNVGKLPTIPGLRTGGRLTRGGLTLVGEDGPELLNPGAGAEVIPLSSRSRALGADGPSGDTIMVTIENVTLAASDLRDIEAALNTLRELAQRARQGRGKVA